MDETIRTLWNDDKMSYFLLLGTKKFLYQLSNQVLYGAKNEMFNVSSFNLSNGFRTSVFLAADVPVTRVSENEAQLMMRLTDSEVKNENFLKVFAGETDSIEALARGFGLIFVIIILLIAGMSLFQAIWVLVVAGIGLSVLGILLSKKLHTYVNKVESKFLKK